MSGFKVQQKALYNYQVFHVKIPILYQPGWSIILDHLLLAYKAYITTSLALILYGWINEGQIMTMAIYPKVNRMSSETSSMVNMLPFKACCRI
jgi:hypothetical protein